MASGKTSRHRVKQASKQAAGFANQGTQETREKANNRPCTYKTIVSCTYTPSAKPQESLPVGYIFYFFQLLEICVLHWEYCSALALGQDVYQNAVYAAIAVRIRAFNCTLVGKHMCSREGVLGSNPTTPKFFESFGRTPATFEECPIEGTSFTVHYTVFRGYLQCDRLLWTDEDIFGTFNAFSEVTLGIFEPFSLVLLA